MVSVVERLSETCVIVPGDSLVANNVASFKRELEELSRSAKGVVVDLSEVQFIDSAGCGALLQFHKRLKERGGGLVLCCLSAPVRALFELVRIQRALDIYPSREAALKALQR